MGYFANGTEAMNYQEAYCMQCVNWAGDDGCPVWDLQEDWNDASVERTPTGEPTAKANRARRVLSRFIPRVQTGNGRCHMFEPSNQVPHWVAQRQVLRNVSHEFCTHDHAGRNEGTSELHCLYCGLDVSHLGYDSLDEGAGYLWRRVS